MSTRIPAHLEVAGLLRRVQAAGDFATVVKRGDADRGSILLIVESRGRHVALLERILDLDAGYRWQAVGPGDSADSSEVSSFLAKRARFDEDSWAIELDVAHPERFIAETIASA